MGSFRRISRWASESAGEDKGNDGQLEERSHEGRRSRVIGRTLEVGTVYSGEPLSEPGRDPRLGSDESGKRRNLVQDVGDDLDGTAKDRA